MLIEHLLTERLMRNLFQNPDFTHRNIIAAQVQNVIEALASTSFSTSEFLRKLDPYYKAIERLQGHRTRRRQSQSFHGEAGFPELRLRAVLPEILTQYRRYARHRLHAP